VEGNESCSERKFQGTKVPRNEGSQLPVHRSQERKTFVPGSESSLERKFQHSKWLGLELGISLFSSGILLSTAGQWLPSLGRRQLTTKTAATAARHLRSSRRWASCLGKIAEVAVAFLEVLLTSILLLDSRLQFYHRYILARLLAETAMLPPSYHGGPETMLCLRTIAF